jgi:hypothetical protein
LFLLPIESSFSILFSATSLKGHAFRRAVNPPTNRPASAAEGLAPQGLKAETFSSRSARLKPCPFKSRPGTIEVVPFQIAKVNTRLEGLLYPVLDTYG